MNVTDILLNLDPPAPQTKQFKQKRLSKLAGEDVIFSLREIGFSKVVELRRQEGEDMDIHILLAGLVEPDFKNEELKRKYSAPTPAELVKKMLLPGEVADLAREIEKLSGYRTVTLEAVKKN